ncbi:DUF4176 domain-containing protein [Clostridium botulinum]|nr:DUF4176 domain-containing protein [Clostridium botulinum]NFS55213.1 DUF4176 domain-containing protein [Clostridium botulinum]NFT18632.1 DUF4176 domain-containing protein [Clostridium botulinum]
MINLLPIGSVVLLKDSDKKLMITGRLQRKVGDKTLTEYDYVSCLYPEGSLRADSSFLFNHEQIERVYFIGFQDEEELEFNKKLSKHINNI